MNINQIKNDYIIPMSEDKRRMILKNMFDSDCEKYFRYLDKRKPKGNIYLIGAILNNYQEKDIDDAKIRIVMGHIDKLMINNPSSKIVNLVNIIYSTLIKAITPQAIISGRIQASTFREIIDKSIDTYKKYPQKKDVDYRHILGRFVSLRNLSGAVFSKFHRRIPDEMMAIAWDEETQLNFINVFERILARYEKVNADFVINKLSLFPKDHTKTTKENVRMNYYSAIYRLLFTILKNAWGLMVDPLKNKEDIIYKLDLAKYYLDKFPLIVSENITGNATDNQWIVAKQFKKLSNKFWKTINTMEKARKPIRLR